MTTHLPPPRPRDDASAPRGAYAIALVCLGNICRSPTAHVVLESTLAEAGLAGEVAVSSGGTGGWHVGQPMDERAAATLRQAGYDPSGPRAEQVAADWFARHDLVLAMDEQNLADLRDLAADAEAGGVEVGDRLRLFRDLDPEVAGVQGVNGTEREVPDPYYGGEDGFSDVLAIVERTSEALTERIQQLLAP